MKVGGYILGEFGNLIAGDSRSAPAVQFQLLHSKVSYFSTCLNAYMGIFGLFVQMLLNHFSTV